MARKIVVRYCVCYSRPAACTYFKVCLSHFKFLLFWTFDAYLILLSLVTKFAKYSSNTLILRKWGWSALIPVSKMAILTFLPVKPLPHNLSAPKREVTCDFCQMAHVNVKTWQHGAISTDKLWSQLLTWRYIRSIKHCKWKSPYA